MSTQRITESDVLKKTLPNGLTVLVKEDHAAPIVAVNMWFGVGSVHESEEMNGLAHFQEHMVFKGTKKYGVGDIGRIVKSAGGNLNAGTSYSYTMYYVVLPSAKFDTALEVQADAMMNSTFDPEEFKKERLVVIDEARMYDDRPESFTFYRTMELGFERHTYRRPIAGYQPIVEKITRDQLLDFYNNYYRPRNGRLVIVGDIDPEVAFRRAEAVYGGWKDGAVAINEPPAEPPQRTFRYMAYGGPMDHAYLGAGFHVPSILHEDYPALQMLAELLSSGRSSRLYRRVREEKQLVTSVNADMLA
ncbi:MAG: insulinase family protein, partial [Candidatus Krumholzibacteria bacterium]|nr:insulinase family protein [Candidatus Krumholzibacteria bacterium]